MPLELIAAAAAAIVGAMATDAWGWTKAGVARLVGRGDAGREESAERRLEEARAELDKLSGTEREQARARVEGAWQARLADLVEEDPGTAQQVREFLVELQRRAPAAGPMFQQATASGNAQQAVLGQGTQTNTFGQPGAGRPA